MDYGRVELADRLAAEYVAGTLRGGARRRFESLLPAHAHLREATRAWQDRLMPLTATVEPVQPSGDVWRRISERIGHGDGKVAAPGWWQKLAFWRGLAAFASVAAIGLAVLLANPGPAAPPIIVVLAPTAPLPGGAASPSLVASISGDRSVLVTRAITPVALQADRSLELWAVPASGPTRSLGVLPGGTGTVALRGKVMAGVDTLAVSVEPLGGSPTGQATGPVVYAGKFVP